MGTGMWATLGMSLAGGSPCCPYNARPLSVSQPQTASQVKDKYPDNGHDPNRPIPPRDPGGKHGTNDKDDKDENR
jgi:hypothetical protein